jgi:antitoxin component YwqK of YwqJK toxin-antitoxin module
MTLHPNRVPRLIVVIAFVFPGAVFFLLLHRPSAPPVTVPETLRRALVLTDGRWYRRGDTNPFTGIMADYHPGGEPLAKCEVSNGLLNGLSETWYTNGQLQVREHFKHGISDGLREKWYENGSRLSQANIVEGKVIGTFQSWHENGQLSEQINMKDGQADGTAFAYYPSGFLKAETSVHDGQVLERKLWNDGEQTAVKQSSAAHE